MKKCVKCGKQYDDLVLICSKCDLYLIKDIASEVKTEDKETYIAQSASMFSRDKTTTTNSVRNTGRRNRVVPVEATEEVKKKVSNSTVFESSDEDDIEPVYKEDIQRHKNRRRRSNRLGRKMLPLMRILLPILLIVVAVVLIIVNWNTIREFLRACIVGGLIGGVGLTFLSLRFGRLFNPDVVTVGLLGGALIGCILKYNLLGTTVELSEFIKALMPCVIICAGIWLILRSNFRR